VYIIVYFGLVYLLSIIIVINNVTEESFSNVANKAFVICFIPIIFFSMGEIIRLIFIIQYIEIYSVIFSLHSAFIMMFTYVASFHLMAGAHDLLINKDFRFFNS
jgi:hypothetical protein